MKRFKLVKVSVPRLNERTVKIVNDFLISGASKDVLAEKIGISRSQLYRLDRQIKEGASTIDLLTYGQFINLVKAENKAFENPDDFYMSRGIKATKPESLEKQALRLQKQAELRGTSLNALSKAVKAKSKEDKENGQD